MSRGVEQQALGASGDNGSAAKSALATLSPTYSGFASGTAGLTPQQKANLLTSGARSLLAALLLVRLGRAHLRRHARTTQVDTLRRWMTRPLPA